MKFDALRFFTCIATFCSLIAVPDLNGQDQETIHMANPVEAEVVRLQPGWGDGKRVRMALVLRHAGSWHTYWSYPGDSGLATSISWELPEGFSTSDFEWPTPKKMEELDIVSYVYDGEVALPFYLHLPQSLPDNSVRLRGKISWLRCTDTRCEPGGTDFEIEIGPQTEAHPETGRLLASIEDARPRPLPEAVRARWTREGSVFQLTVDGMWSDGKVIDFFPNPPKEIVITKVEGPLEGVATFRVLTATAPEGISGVPGVIIAGEPPRGYIIEVDEIPGTDVGKTEGDNRVATTAPAAKDGGFDTRGTGRVTSLWQAILFGILGGLILNLMPCVLPAISLKLVGFIQQAGESKKQIFLHGLAFAVGIYVWFLLVALAFIGVRLAGGELNWAFQFQNPWMILAMGAVLVVFAMNLFGLFEIMLPSKTGAVVERVASTNGLLGSFSHGVFATILATPCTAPFLGSALGFALAQPMRVIPVIFLSIATGMALPYLLLSVRPGWVRFLPKPGNWMVRLKEFMGFPLLATVLWLVWLLGQMRGTNAATAALAFYLLLGMATWFYGAFLGYLAKPIEKRFGIIGLLFVAGLIVWGWPVLGAAFAQTPKAVREDSSKKGRARDGVIYWETFSNLRLAELLAGDNRPVFVDFTADWCWTCKVNEQLVLSRRDVIDAFEESNFVMLKADFTNFDPEIKARLEEFERGGVPMYVVWPAERGRKPVLLPEVITPELVIEVARQAGMK